MGTVIGLLAESVPRAEIFVDYPDLEPQDIRQALAYAARSVREEVVPI
jgi:uncharacterized protein (DUF433 family)